MPDIMNRKTGQDVLIEANWKNLLHITYKAEQKHFLKIIPPGLEVDKFHGDSYITLVAFEFTDTKVKGIPVPVYGSFPEINLRYYVTDRKRSGVVFIKEFVPRSAIGLAANTLYNEHYSIISMETNTNKTNDYINISHTFRVDNNEYSISALAEKRTTTPQENTLEHYIKQKGWGFGKTPDGDRLSYKVEHTVWELYPVIETKLNIDYAKVFGDNWSFLNDEQPYNILLAKGSPAKIYMYDVEK
ncbi:MAG: DUF2071 domain-containing protein [Ignavibacteriae bacterium]|nr:MAG: DUF2071 domain-containing protein [Ignavibacteriota bacterium]